jgi:hypothetical protein
MRLRGLMGLIITIHDAPRDFPQESCPETMKIWGVGNGE